MIDIGLIFRIIVFPGFTSIIILKLFCYWGERKFEARIKNRVGLLVGGPTGLFKPLVDFIILLLSANRKIILPCSNIIADANFGTGDVGISACDVK